MEKFAFHIQNQQTQIILVFHIATLHDTNILLTIRHHARGGCNSRKDVVETISFEIATWFTLREQNRDGVVKAGTGVWMFETKTEDQKIC